MAKSDQFGKHFDRKREEEKRHLKSLPGEDDAPLPPPAETIKNDKQTPGRNDPCPCGSGRKYKQCCAAKS